MTEVARAQIAPKPTRRSRSQVWKSVEALDGLVPARWSDVSVCVGRCFRLPGLGAHSRIDIHVVVDRRTIELTALVSLRTTIDAGAARRLRARLRSFFARRSFRRRAPWRSGGRTKVLPFLEDGFDRTFCSVEDLEEEFAAIDRYLTRACRRANRDNRQWASDGVAAVIT